MLKGIQIDFKGGSITRNKMFKMIKWSKHKDIQIVNIYNSLQICEPKLDRNKGEMHEATEGVRSR